MGGTDRDPHPGEHPLSSTASLLARARTGDGAARDEILQRYREPLTRCLRGQLSPGARGLLDTADIVQQALTAAVGRLEQFEYRGLGSFWCYLRRIGINMILAEERRQGVRPVEGHDLHQLNAAADDSSERPSAVLMRKEAREAFEAAIAELAEQARAAVLLRLELGLSYALIAAECRYPSEDAARMAIGRSIVRLAGKLASFQP